MNRRSFVKAAAAAPAKAVLVSSFLNLGATARWVMKQKPGELY